MKKIIAILTIFVISNAYASRCGLAVTFVNVGDVEISFSASIDWPDMDVDSGEEGKFPGDVAHPIKLGSKSEQAELFAFPCGYPGDPSEFWVNYGIWGGEKIERIKYKKGMKVVVGKGGT